MNLTEIVESAVSSVPAELEKAGTILPVDAQITEEKPITAEGEEVIKFFHDQITKK